uniref:Uncharacterized protein n=1 Tax=Arundo donax TaxID=35708 RepID=A0A0A9FH26_ARUDO
MPGRSQLKPKQVMTKTGNCCMLS